MAWETNYMSAADWPYQKPNFTCVQLWLFSELRILEKQIPLHNNLVYQLSLITWTDHRKEILRLNIESSFSLTKKNTYMWITLLLVCGLCCTKIRSSYHCKLFHLQNTQTYNYKYTNPRYFYMPHYRHSCRCLSYTRQSLEQ